VNVVVDDQCLSLLLRGELVEVVEGNTAFYDGVLVLLPMPSVFSIRDSRRTVPPLCRALSGREKSS